MARLPIGPHVLDVSEALYAALFTAGFVAAENVAMSNLIQWQLLGAARSMISDADEARHTRPLRRPIGTPSQLLGHLLRLEPLPNHGRDLGGRGVRRSRRLGF